MRISRTFALFAVAAMMAAPGASTWAQATPKPLKIGIIGTGKIGGALAEHWAKAGHQLLISSRHPERLQPLAAKLGPRVRVGTPREAAAFGEVVLISVPYNALPQVGKDYARELKGKVVLETGNPYPQRDGEMAEKARKDGTGVASKAYLPGVRLVRAFNSINASPLRNEANRAGQQYAIPLAGDDEEALAIASQLVRDAGFDPVVVGDLSTARKFDVNTDVYVRLLTADELRKELGLPR
jgi:8-hydroxy-5-deazaflavin:NADPH oxidoreductase